MNRLPASRTLITALLGALLAVGSIAPAFAQQQDSDEDKDERRAARKEQRDQRKQQRQAEPEQPREQAPQASVPAPQRHEHWDDAARQQQQQRREALDIDQARQRETMGQRIEQQRRESIQQQSDRREQADLRIGEQRRQSEQLGVRERAIVEARDRDASRERNQDRRDDRRETRNEERRDNDRNDRISREQQQRRIEDQRRQAVEWQRHQSSRRSQIEQHSRELERQRRNAQYRYQQDYYRRWLAQQSRWNASRHDYYSDPFYYTASSYRYGYGGNWYNTNQYGANLLRQAVRDGYQEGYYAGRADRLDRWRFDYRNNYGYIDGTFGYNGYYVNRNDYRYYFRQGFERGYRDAYYGRNQYGRYDNGVALILPVILSAILGFRNY